MGKGEPPLLIFKVLDHGGHGKPATLPRAAAPRARVVHVVVSNAHRVSRRRRRHAPQEAPIADATGPPHVRLAPGPGPTVAPRPRARGGGIGPPARGRRPRPAVAAAGDEVRTRRRPRGARRAAAAGVAGGPPRHAAGPGPVGAPESAGVLAGGVVPRPLDGV